MAEQFILHLHLCYLNISLSVCKLLDCKIIINVFRLYIPNYVLLSKQFYFDLCGKERTKR